jgi:hypothetical protein
MKVYGEQFAVLPSLTSTTSISGEISPKSRSVTSTGPKKAGRSTSANFVFK